MNQDVGLEGLYDSPSTKRCLSMDMQREYNRSLSLTKFLASPQCRAKNFSLNPAVMRRPELERCYNPVSRSTRIVSESKHDK